MSVRDDFKENLKYWRNKAGLTQEQLSEKIGYGLGYISEIESRNMFPKPETIDAISRALGISAAQLFEEKGSPVNAIRFDSADFVRQVSDELYDRLNASLIAYFEQKLGR